MRKFFCFFVMLSFILVGCSSHLDKTGKEFKSAIINDSMESYAEDEFSFLIYKDKAKGQYLAKVWVPINGVPNSIERYYSYNENKKLESWDSKLLFDDRRASEDYAIMYKSGNFLKK
ncbi:hypothetical protein [Enterococcus faecalis]|uniref:hypothetical protein n=1 Tax=Enterococcus faecalis TaxID=1351 RepID=UPI001F5858CB|nr:hypothetical protein [Enterococcus faecalis]